ncbi:glycerophosphodiester phosphodiesterase family protein [Aegicerativicinus sediminis]|uniref:glycerophosphodiester phosphodiesterase family protein n=1 Tax=Aegicerativicinus sediminis TaxID=2893202 RepID=UPI001E588DF2|nr:glycerophosphodiester phosphodiesterase family protein [Aegicerativicinus sediminis]
MIQNKIIFFIVAIFCMSCSKDNIDIQGHRGYRGMFPENSMLGFEKALELGVTTLEMDVVITADKQVIVSHEPYMNHEICLKQNGRTISPKEERKYNIYKMPYSMVKTFDCGSKEHPEFPGQEKIPTVKPLLSEVIEMAERKSQREIQYNIEIKSSLDDDGLFTPELSAFVELVIHVIEEFGVENRTTLQSFDVRALDKINRTGIGVSRSLLVDENETIDQKLKSLTFKPEIISPYYKLLSTTKVKELQQQGFKIIPWTVNEKKDIANILQMNVDGIISDYPERVINLVVK